MLLVQGDGNEVADIDEHHVLDDDWVVQHQSLLGTGQGEPVVKSHDWIESSGPSWGPNREPLQILHYLSGSVALEAALGCTIADGVAGGTVFEITPTIDGVEFDFPCDAAVCHGSDIELCFQNNFGSESSSHDGVSTELLEELIELGL